jgi:predicted type IV restriction endonuclease
MANYHIDISNGGDWFVYDTNGNTASEAFHTKEEAQEIADWMNYSNNPLDKLAVALESRQFEVWFVAVLAAMFALVVFAQFCLWIAR